MDSKPKRDFHHLGKTISFTDPFEKTANKLLNFGYPAGMPGSVDGLNAPHDRALHAARIAALASYLREGVTLPKMHPDVANAIQQIDAALYSGDTFHAAPLRAELTGYVTRWAERLAELTEEAAEEIPPEFTVDGNVHPLPVAALTLNAVLDMYSIPRDWHVHVWVTQPGTTERVELVDELTATYHMRPGVSHVRVQPGTRVEIERL